MRVLYVWDAEYPWDVRTEKVCLALAQHGHHVVITARNVQGRPRSELLPEGTVERLPAFQGWNSRALSFPAFFNPFWLSHVRRVAQRHAVDLIIVRDIPLAPTAILASGGRWPVILDMAENYPAMIADIWADGRQRALDVLVRNPRVVAAVERFVLRRVDHTITVVEESKSRLIALGVPGARVSVVSNTPSKARVASLVPRTASDPLKLVYLGLMEHHRGIATVLDSAKVLMEADVHFHLDLVGDGRDYQHLRAYAGELGLNASRVTFHGRLSHAEAIRVLGQAHVGLVPHLATEAWNTTISNKLFDYMAAGLAVVTSDAVPSARVVRESNAGFVFRSGDGIELADTIRRFLDISAWEHCRHAGQDSIRSDYNWEADTRRLLDVVSAVGTSGPSAPG
jgi:glycosyltransferase involved in cell wall biosynthesis